MFCVGQALPLFLVGITLAHDHDSRTPRGDGVGAASTRRRRLSGIGASSASSGALLPRRRAVAPRADVYASLSRLDIGTYAIFAMESPDPGRRRSKNHPTPPHARHTKTLTYKEGSTPRHAAVCSAMVRGILYPTTSNARSTS